MKQEHREAFTVLEFMASLAVMAILASLLFPAVKMVLTASERARCGANLQQLGRIAMLYAAEHNNNLVPLRRDTDDADPPGMWYDHLHEYVGRARGRAGRTVGGVVQWHAAFKCPMMDERYAINYICGRSTGPNTGPKGYLKIGQGFVNGEAVRLPGGPAKTAWFADPLPGGEYFTPEYYDGTGSKFLGFPHGDTCNVLFMDGHVENIENPDFVKNPALLREKRWVDFFGRVP